MYLLQMRQKWYGHVTMSLSIVIVIECSTSDPNGGGGEIRAFLPLLGKFCLITFFAKTRFFP